MNTPLTEKDIRRIERLKVIASNWPEAEVRVSFWDDEGDCVNSIQLSPELLKSMCNFTLDRNENFTQAWRNSYGKRGG